ncbi:MAG: aminoacyl-tRNA hydrolase [Bacteroidota bacterium]
MKYLIVGLGNIGEQYRDTRHNIGFMVIEKILAEKETKVELVRHAYKATVKHKGRQLVLIMPTTYMNLSGKAVRHHMKEEKLTPDKVLIITDDLALPFGRLKLRPKGSAGGHNGLKDIEEKLNTREYPRLRIGIDDNYSKGRQVDYVLSPFTEDEMAGMEDVIDRSVKGVYAFATIGIDKAMNEVNKK